MVHVTSLLLALLAAVVLPALGASVERRSLTKFTAPTNYSYTWGLEGKRCSYSTSSYIIRYQSTASFITQKVVNDCAAHCESVAGCVFFNPIQMKGGKEGAVLCAIYSAAQPSKSATSSVGTSASGGTVVKSYGYTRKSPVPATKIVAPTSYASSWSVVGKRTSYSVSSYVKRYSITNATTVNQDVVNVCANYCNGVPGCAFFSPIQMNGGTEGAVICAIYNAAQASSSATSSAGTSASGGTVVKSYGYTRSSPVPAAKLVAPTSYSSTWSIEGKRPSYSASSYVNRYSIKNATTVTQDVVNVCANYCNGVPGCAFFSPIQMNGGTEGAVICAIYNAAQASSSATSSAGTSASGGTVTRSYGFARSSPVPAAALVAPTNYNSSWSIEGKRASYSVSSYVNRYSITNATTITQDVVKVCANYCDGVPGCAFFSPIQMNGGTEGAVICAVYNAAQASSSATSSAGTSASGGTVVRSYGFTRSSPVPAAALVAPTNYNSTWAIEGKRASYSTNDYIYRYPVDNATTITQAVVEACAARCEAVSGCDFFTPIQMNGGTEGTILCAIFSVPQTSASATSTAGTAASGGTVVRSFGFTRTVPVPAVFQAPSGYNYSWASEEHRCSYDTDQFFNRYQIPDAVTVTQSVVDTCAGYCNSTDSCVFYNTVQMDGGTEGGIICALFTAFQTKISASSINGTDLGGGTVVRSFGFARGSVAPTTTSPTVPASPVGARLVRYKGCSTTEYTIPMFVNKNYPLGANDVSNSSTVYIVQHGSVRDFDDAFTALYRIIGDTGVIIAPEFYAQGDVAAPKTWYEPDTTLAWPDNDWFNGDDAISPADTAPCSSFDVIDTLIASLRNKKKYPNLKRIVSVAHSGGAAFMGRYGMLTTTNTDITYVLANTPAMPYFTSARPIAPQNCQYFEAWGYGFKYSLPRYVAANNPGATQAFKNWIQRDVTLMTGDYDTYSRDTTGDQSCYALCEGGNNRRDRGYAYWAYINLLAGTSTNVSAYYGYDALKKQVTPLSPAPTFKLRHCTVDKVPHYNYGMYSSECGRAAIAGAAKLPAAADPGPIQPA